MSRKDPQFNLRIPELLRDKVMGAAKANKRSSTAEIIARLEASFDAEAAGFAPTTPARSAAGTSFARPLALGDAESLLDAARAAFRKEQIALLTDQLIAEIELTAVRGEGTDFDLTMTASITENIDKLAALKGTDPLQEYAALMETVEKRLDEASSPSTGAKRIRRTRTPNA
ncbi:Arc family DNA-binding protein [Ectopseudomonas mendocina]|nr:Arc family DNA-binding protein [Pseudomonas mendocina]